MKEHMKADAAQFQRLRHWKDYRERASNLFRTDWALRWFIRRHEERLVASGALLKTSRGTFIDPVPFSAMALNLMREAHARQEAGA